MNLSGIGPIRDNRPVVPSGRAPKKPSPACGDSVTINDQVRVSSLAEIVRSLPETRPEKVSEARQRLTEGYYDDPAVRDQTAENVLHSGVLGL